MDRMQHTTSRARFGFIFSGTARRWRREHDLALAEIGMSDATWPPLVHLDLSGGGISQTELATRVGIDGSSLVRLLDLLADRGWVERRTDPNDRRARLLFLTPDGEAASRRVRDLLERTEKEMLGDVSDAELDAALSVIERIDARITVMTAEARQ